MIDDNKEECRDIWDAPLIWLLMGVSGTLFHNASFFSQNEWWMMNDIGCNNMPDKLTQKCATSSHEK